jgi:hypothetical protein
MHRQLHLADDAGPAALRDVVDRRVGPDEWPQFARAVAATHRLLHLAATAGPGSALKGAADTSDSAPSQSE